MVRLLMAIAWSASLPAATTIQGAGGLAVSVDGSGAYNIFFASSAWRFSGDVGLPLANVAAGSGSDGIGAYAEISFDYSTDVPRHASIRAYQDRPVVLFSIEYQGDGANVAPFPELSVFPGLLPFHLSFPWVFCLPSFSAMADEGPWVFFDDNADAFLISPAANFLTARTWRGPAGTIVAGIAPQLANLPAGFRHQTLLVAKNGINAAFEEWGRALTDLAGKSRPPNNSGAILNQVGYWTDNGGTYYYHVEPGLSYSDTLLGVKADFDLQGIPLGYMQLDSWFYPKGPLAQWQNGAGGIYEYTAAPDLFPSGLQVFQQTLGTPLITHARWLDDASPTRQQYRVSGNVATDPAYWNRVAGYLSSSGVVTYEQDWLGANAHTDFNLSDPYAFLDNMASAMDGLGLSMQYCMGTAGDFLQSTRYHNLTTARTSQDRFDRSRWTEFLYSSRLASALGIWPFTDVFMSAEQDNLLLATLSAGPVGLGDRIGAIDAVNLRRAVRADGVIVKPDAAIVPLDQAYLAGARGLDTPLIASTYTDFNPLRAWYVLAYPQGDNTGISFRPSELGAATPVYVYDYFSGAGLVAAPDDAVSRAISGGRAYYVVAPIGPSGIAVLGDSGQFVMLGRQRIAALADDGIVHLTVSFAGGETSRTIIGYAPSPPNITVRTGSAGTLRYDPDSLRFAIEVGPAPDGTARVELSSGPSAAPVSGPGAAGRAACE